MGVEQETTLVKIFPVSYTPLFHSHGKKVWYNMGRSHPSPIRIDTSLGSVEMEQQHHGTSDIGPKNWVQEGGCIQRLVWGRD